MIRVRPRMGGHGALRQGLYGKGIPDALQAPLTLMVNNGIVVKGQRAGHTLSLAVLKLS